MSRLFRSVGAFRCLLKTFSTGQRRFRPYKIQPAALIPLNITNHLYRRPVLVAVLAFFWPLKRSETKQEPPTDKNHPLTDDLQEADTLFDNNQYHECLEFIDNLDNVYEKDVEILWRKSRALFKLATQSNLDKKQKHSLVNEAHTAVSLALETNEEHFEAHKWMSVILDLKCSCGGLSERVKNLENVKKHMQKAIEINPRDAVTLYMLGEWCYRLADMPWYQRKIAQTLFSTPPRSSFHEAIQYFSRAETVEPRFYSMNLLMLGKTYLKLGKHDIAKYYLDLALRYPARCDDDHHANREAQNILKRLK